MGSPVPKSSAYEQARKTVEEICTELGNKHTLFVSTTKIEPYNLEGTVSLRPPQDGPVYINDAGDYFKALLDIEHKYETEQGTLGGIERTTLTILPSYISKLAKDFIKELRQKFDEQNIPIEILKMPEYTLTRYKFLRVPHE